MPRNRLWDKVDLRKLYWEDKLSLETIGKMFNMSVGAVNSAMYYRSIPTRSHSEAGKLIVRSEEHCHNLSIVQTTIMAGRNVRGINNPNWRGGTSYEPYSPEFYDTQDYIRDRDNHICQLCGVPEQECSQALSVHHIDYNKQNNNEDNLISLCQRCHTRTQTNRAYWHEIFG